MANKVSARGGAVSAGRPGQARPKRGKAAASAASRVPVVVAQEPLTHRLAFWGVLGILFVPAFFSGMFFPPAQEKVLIVAAAVFWLTWVWKYFKRETGFLAQPLDYFALALPLAAVAAAFGAASYSLALNEVVKYILYFLVFWSVARLITGEHEVHQVLHAVYLSALGVALAGLGAATGIVPVLDGFLYNRIYSTFQYPNATASYLAAALILGLYLWHRADRYTMPREIPALGRLNAYQPYRFLYAVANFLLLAVLVGTKSYGGLLTFVVVVVLYFLFLPAGSRAALGYQLAAAVVAGAPSVLLFLHEVEKKRMGAAWLCILGGAVLAALFQLGWVFLARRPAGPRGGLRPASRRVLAVAGLLVVLAALAVATQQILLLFRHPELLATPFYVKLRARDVIERLYFYLDGLAMFLRRPILGWGGGGWQAAYRSFQSFLYNSNQGHSYYIQVLVEMGSVGILIVIGLWYSFLRLARRLFRAAGDNQARRLLVLTVTMVAVEVGTHALVDFDLALSALFLVIWAMFGVAWALDRLDREETAPRKERRKSYVPYNHTALLGSTAFAVVAVLLGLTLAASNAYALEAGNLYGELQNQSQNQNDSQYQMYRVVSDLQKAARYNPLNPVLNGPLPGDTVDGALATLDLYQGQAARGVALAEKAVALDPYDAESYATLANVENNDNQGAAAVAAAEKAVALAPFQQEWYNDLAQVEVSAGIQALSGKDKNVGEARTWFAGVLRIPGRLAARMNSLDPVEKQLWNVGPPLQATPTIDLATGISHYFLGDYGPATRELEAARSNSSLKDQALLWQSLVDARTGKSRQGAALLARVRKDNPGLAADYDTLAGLSLENPAAGKTR